MGADHQQVMDAIHALNTKMDSRFNQMEERVISEVKKLKLEITGVSEQQVKQGKAISEVQIQVEILKQRALNCDLIILGIPSLKPQDDLLAIVNNIIAIIGCNAIRTTDVKALYLMKSDNNKSKFIPICLQLYSATFKGAILAQQKKYGPVPLQKIDNNAPDSDTHKIIFKHRMTQYNSQLLKEAFKFKTEFKYTYCWFQDTVLLKKAENSKPLRVFSLEDLENLADIERKSPVVASSSSTSVE